MCNSDGEDHWTVQLGRTGAVPALGLEFACLLSSCGGMNGGVEKGLELLFCQSPVHRLLSDFYECKPISLVSTYKQSHPNNNSSKWSPHPNKKKIQISDIHHWHDRWTQLWGGLSLHNLIVSSGSDPHRQDPFTILHRYTGKGATIRKEVWIRRGATEEIEQ